VVDKKILETIENIGVNMRLKSLELDGFKSFVDETHIDFTSGFTAIVGPNGCGKSNVSDAIRWVIGEQSSKSLRGTKSTDLIFNGSSTRKAVNRAEISLTLGQVPAGIRIANVPNVSDEVKVTRCYHRSGESEFYINQVPCRLKDITDFLLDVGISPKVLSVIEQGHIQDIIVSKPENRRILIEEAAGILKFKHRKNEALRKLDASTQNLERITDIVQELGRQAESLKRQAAKAERYKQYQGEVKELSLKLFAKKIRQYKIDLEAIEEEFAEQAESKAEKNTRASFLDNQITQLNLEIEEAFRLLTEKRERVYQLANKMSKSEHTIELKKSQIDQSETDICSATDDIARLQGEITDQADQAEDQRTQLGTLSDEINTEESKLAEENKMLDEKRSCLNDIETQVKEGDMQVLKLFHNISQNKSDLTALETRGESLEHRKQTLKTEFEEINTLKEKVSASLDQSNALFQEKSEQLAQLKSNRETLHQKTEQQRQQLSSETDRLDTLKEEYLSQSSLLTSLKELRSKFEGFEDGVQSLMNYNENGGRLTGLREVLADILKTPAEYEMAIATALGEKLQSVIVNSYDDSVEAITYLKEHSSGRSSFIPLNMKAPDTPPVYLNGNPGILGKALNFVECEEEYRQVIEMLLGHVVLVTDLATAVQVFQNPEFNGSVVTRNGEMIDSQGMVFGGSVQKDSSSLLSQNREVEELEAKTGQLNENVGSALSTVEESKNFLVDMERQLEEAGRAVHEVDIALNNSRNEREQNQKELERLGLKLSSLEQEQNVGRQELAELKSRKETLVAEMENSNAEKTRQEEALSGLRHELDSFRTILEEKSNEIGGIKVRIASLKGKRENTLTEINRLDLQQENHRHQIQKRENDTADSQKRIDETQLAIEFTEKEILEDVREKDGLEEEAIHEEEALREKEGSVKQMEQESKELSRTIQELTEAISKVELKRSEIKIQLAHIEERTFEDFNVTLPELMNREPEEFDVQEVDQAVRELRQKIGRMGEVNLAALSDFQKTNERYQFLKTQQEDLSDSIHLLHQTIERISRTTRQRFVDTFEKVNENFKEIFAHLFRGGKAELSLTDESNPLESGVEISANPLGKHMQNLTLLSGGEKSMTAIALMFAVFKVRPSPFCLLDEVDAPLDEANVIRFQEMLKQMSGNTQFILITHNQKTMSFADVLYGITMEERGVSKAVSVNLN
jgi:chromosome segregation protein|tara:strand:+ start:9782 stop:13390 length:3609 start_codon:yes stop_codon:yes gene_type:complete